MEGFMRENPFKIDELGIRDTPIYGNPHLWNPLPEKKKPYIYIYIGIYRYIYI